MAYLTTINTELNTKIKIKKKAPDLCSPVLLTLLISITLLYAECHHAKTDTKKTCIVAGKVENDAPQNAAFNLISYECPQLSYPHCLTQFVYVSTWKTCQAVGHQARF